MEGKQLVELMMETLKTSEEVNKKLQAELELLRELVKDPRADIEQFDPTCAWCHGDPDWDAEIALHRKDCPWLKWKETYQP